MIHHSLGLFIGTLLVSYLTISQQRWQELKIGADEGIILVQAVSLGTWRGAVVAADALSTFLNASVLRAQDEHTEACIGISILVGGTCATWLLVLPILRQHSQRQVLSSVGEGLTWAEELWVWSSVVGMTVFAEYPLLWLSIGKEPFTWALSVLCGSIPVALLILWWVVVVAWTSLMGPRVGARKAPSKGVGYQRCNEQPCITLRHHPASFSPNLAPAPESRRSQALPWRCCRDVCTFVRHPWRHRGTGACLCLRRKGALHSGATPVVPGLGRGGLPV